MLLKQWEFCGWLKVLKIAPLDDTVYAVKSGYEHDTRTMAINKWGMRILSSLFYCYPHNDSVTDESCVVSETAISESSQSCIPPCTLEGYKVFKFMLHFTNRFSWRGVPEQSLSMSENVDYDGWKIWRPCKLGMQLNTLCMEGDQNMTYNMCSSIVFLKDSISQAY